MAGPKRWPPLLIPQLPRAWVRFGVLLSVVLSLALAREAMTTSCGFGDELCHPWLGTLQALTVTVFWFWLLAPCIMIALGLVHVGRSTVHWIRLDVVRPRESAAEEDLHRFGLL